ncbi:MAG: bifunctional diaminohydroxyphosphoribosylaminopyrimidine deaminase/5-amino-6-(5-phosphoribosylamino)uracil reductase RibD [Planctomycetota bacterium]|nr:MAG: bifunctional diaminohydroxyphosphoribosylaminopyrimidine deaminase/5-amino-6-(5-phosphoribosylamino)uracil reductase RibD [Planctomycetota bacterium]
MARALELAARGEGLVEPNPMVGCVLVRDGAVVGEGWHRRFGAPHAEVEALREAGGAARGATAYVTLEPCDHLGKTPPCTAALLEAGVVRVVVACQDPNPQVNGRGLARLQAAGVAVQVGVLAGEAASLLAPFIKLMTQRRPWVIAKWAMTLDGKLATVAGDSRWISDEPSRAVVHRLRGRVDAIIVGRGTAARDDPALTARPAGPRLATRIVLDSQATLPVSSQLVRTASQAPVLVAAAADAPSERCHALRSSGVEVWQASRAAASPADRWAELLDELGRRQMTNVLVEGGSTVLGALFDAGALDELHVFLAPKLVGGATAPSPIGGAGTPCISDAVLLRDAKLEQLGADVYLHGRLH